MEFYVNYTPRLQRQVGTGVGNGQIRKDFGEHGVQRKAQPWYAIAIHQGVQPITIEGRVSRAPLQTYQDKSLWKKVVLLSVLLSTMGSRRELVFSHHDCHQVAVVACCNKFTPSPAPPSSTLCPSEQSEHSRVST